VTNIHTPVPIKVASVMHDVRSSFHRPQSIMFAINTCVDHFFADGSLGENQIIKNITFALALGLIARAKQPSI